MEIFYEITPTHVQQLYLNTYVIKKHVPTREVFIKAVAVKFVFTVYLLFINVCKNRVKSVNLKKNRKKLFYAFAFFGVDSDIGCLSEFLIMCHYSNQNHVNIVVEFIES